MVREAVDFDGHAVFRPEGVQFQPADHRVEVRARQVGAADEGEQSFFGGRPRERRRRLRQDPAERRDAPPTARGIRSCAQRVDVQDPEALAARDCLLEFPRSRGGGRVQDRADRAGHGDAFDVADVLRRDARDTVTDDAFQPAPTPLDEHVDRRAWPGGQQLQQPEGAPMADDRRPPARQHRRHLAMTRRPEWPVERAEQIHAAVEGDEAAAAQPRPDLLAGEAGLDGLRARDDAMLPRGDVGQPAFRGGPPPGLHGCS